MVMSAIVILSVLLIAFALGLYVAVALGITSIAAGMVSFGPSVLLLFGHIPWNVVSSPAITVVPLFFLMGEMLMRSGVTDDMYEAIYKWFKKVTGGMLYTNIAACAFFASISGSSLATVTTIGSVALPAMLRRGYQETFVVGSLVAGGTLGILIPPSVLLIMYGLLAEVSIGQLYIAAVIPGLLMATMFCMVIFFFCLINPQVVPKSQEESVPWGERMRSLGSLAPIVVLFLIVLGTIYLGIATAVESAAFGAMGAFIIALFRRRVSTNMLKGVFLATANNTAMMVFILIGAFLLQFIIAFLGIPEALSQWATALKLSSLELVLYIILLYLVLGMFIETLAMLVTTIPIIMPIINAMGIDPIWFGIIATVMCEMSLITPPVGMNLFVMQGVKRQVPESKGGMRETYLGALPFVIAVVVVITLLVAFPEISTFLLYDKIK